MKISVFLFFLFLSMPVFTEPYYNADDELLKAADNNNFEKLKEALNRGADINEQDRNYGANIHLKDTALMKACKKGNLEIVEYLISHGANIWIRDVSGDSALAYAAAGSNPLVVQKLFDAGYQLNNTAPYKDDTYMLLASGKGLLDIVKIFLKNGANINTVRDGLWSIAVKQDNFDLINYLLENDKPFQKENLPLVYACLLGKTEMARYLIDKGADIKEHTQDDENAFIIASKLGNIELMDMLISKGIDFKAANKDGDNALLLACTKPDMDTIKYLLGKGLSIESSNKKGQTPVMKIKGYDNFKYLVSKKAKIKAKDSSGNTLLWYHTDDEKIFEYLLSKGIKINALNGNLESVIFRNSGYGKPEFLEFLISHKADIEIKDKNLQTPIFHSVKAGNLAHTKLFIDKKAKLDIQDKDGVTPVMIAARYGYIPVLELLLQKKVNLEYVTNIAPGYQIEDEDDFFYLMRNHLYSDPNRYSVNALVYTILWAQTKAALMLIEAGSNPDFAVQNKYPVLMIAAARGNNDIVKSLVSHGADLLAKDPNGKTALDWALYYKQTEIVKLLQQLMAKK